MVLNCRKLHQIFLLLLQLKHYGLLPLWNTKLKLSNCLLCLKICAQLFLLFPQNPCHIKGFRHFPSYKNFIVLSRNSLQIPEHFAKDNLRRVIEVVITRRSWKFASITVAKTQKSLVNTDFSGTPKTTENSISKNISKKIEYPMISA